MSANSRWAAANGSSSNSDGVGGDNSRVARWSSRTTSGNRSGYRNNSTNRSVNWRVQDPSMQTQSKYNKQEHDVSRQQRPYQRQTERSDIQDLYHQMKSLNTSDSTGGMRKSQRNWSAEHDNLKRGSVHEAPLISRTTDRGANVLLTAAGQHAMWQNITNRIKEISTKYDVNTLPDSGSSHKQELEQVVELFRKLREAVFATKWANNDLQFSIQVFELSATHCAVVSNMGELLKSLKGLVDDLYPKTRHTNFGNPSHYTALYILYHVCYTQSPAVVTRLIEPANSHPDLKYAKEVMHSLLHLNYRHFFRLYKDSPWPAFTSMLDTCQLSIQERAAKILSASYYNTSIDWAKEAIGISAKDDQSAIELIQQWSGGRVDRVDENRLVWFSRGKASRP